MKTIYISGPITDLTTGQPREGWQQDYNEIDLNLLPVKDGKRLLDNGDFGKENWSGKL